MYSLPQHPFRFGIISYPECKNLVSLAHQAEDLGYDAFHLSDHVFNIAPIAAMTAVAMATSKIRIGSMVFGNDFWHPAILAREALAIDCLSNGRLEFGLGSGWYTEDYRQTGIPMDPPGVRISRLEESVTILKGLLSGEVVTFQGKYYNITELNLVAKPMQLPHPPLTIGGGSRRVLSLAARQADIISINSHIPSGKLPDLSTNFLEGTRQKVEWICQAAGEHLPKLEFSVFTSAVDVTNSPNSAIDKVIQGWRSWGTNSTREQALESPHVLVGDSREIIDKLQMNRERFGFSYYIIGDTVLEQFAPVVKQLAGE